MTTSLTTTASESTTQSTDNTSSTQPGKGDISVFVAQAHSCITICDRAYISPCIYIYFLLNTDDYIIIMPKCC